MASDSSHSSPSLSDSDIESDQSIYQNLVARNQSSKVLAKRWIKAQVDDPTECCNNFYGLIFACANIDFSDSAEVSLSILESIQDLEEEEVELPILSQRFCSVLNTFIRHCFEDKRAPILRNGTFWDNVTTILHKLIQSRVKAHRRTGVIISLSILNALILLSEEESDSSMDESENEEDPVALLAESIFEALFETCFHLAYRDSEVDIRKLCVLQLKSWFENHPEKFLYTCFFRYVSWLSPLPKLDDRIQCLKITRIILSNPRSDVIETFAERQCSILNSQLSSQITQEICLATECLSSVNFCPLLKLIDNRLRLSSEKMKYPSLVNEVQFYKINENLFHKDQAVASASAKFTIANLKKSIQDERLSISLLRFANKIFVTDATTGEDSFSLANELDCNLLIFVDSYFSGECDEILQIEDMLRILESEEETSSFQSFTSSFIKAVAQRAFMDEPPDFRNENRKAAEKANNSELKVGLTRKLLSSLGPLVISHQNNKAILRNLLNVCQFLYSDEDHTFDSQDLETLIASIVTILKNSAQPVDCQLYIKVLSSLRSKCLSQMDETILERNVRICIDDFAAIFQNLSENLEARVEESAISYFVELTSILKKLSLFYPHFDLLLPTFQGCEFFVTYVYECLVSSMETITIWFEVIELSLLLMCNHAMSILDRRAEALEKEEIYCLQVCLKFSLKYMYFKHSSDSRLYFVNSFYSMIRLMKRLHEEDLRESFIDNEHQARIDDGMLYFITQHLDKFQDDSSTKVLDFLCTEFCTMLSTVQPISRRMFYKLLHILMTKAENLSLQRKLLEAIGSLFNKKQLYLFDYLLKFLAICLLRPNKNVLMEQLKVTLTVLAQKVDKDSLANEFHELHCTGIRLYTAGKVESEFFRILKVALCFLTAVGFRVLKSFLDRNTDSDLSADENFKSYKQQIVRRCLANNV